MRARFVAERRFVQVITSPSSTPTCATTACACSASSGAAPGARQAASLGLGFGADVTAIEPGAARAPGVTPATATTRRRSCHARRAALRISGAAWRVAALLFADASLFDTHYDIDARRCHRTAGNAVAGPPGSGPSWSGGGSRRADSDGPFPRLETLAGGGDTTKVRLAVARVRPASMKRRCCVSSTAACRRRGAPTRGLPSVRGLAESRPPPTPRTERATWAGKAIRSSARYPAQRSAGARRVLRPDRAWRDG